MTKGLSFPLLIVIAQLLAHSFCHLRSDPATILDNVNGNEIALPLALRVANNNINNNQSVSLDKKSHNDNANREYIVSHNKRVNIEEEVLTSNSGTRTQTDTPTHAFKERATGLILHSDVLKEHRVAPTQIHEVTFVLEQRDMDKLTDILYDVSDPLSYNYGKHMTRQEILDFTTKPGTRDAIAEYLLSAGAVIVSETLYGEYITASAPVSVWEEMFDTEFHAYSVLPSDRTHTYRREDDESVRSYIRTHEYSLPVALIGHVHSVMNTIQMPPINIKRMPRKRFTTEEAKDIAKKISQNSHHATTERAARKAAQIAVEKALVRGTGLTGSDVAERELTERELQAPTGLEPIGYIYPEYLSQIYNIDSNLGHPLVRQAAFAAYDQYYSPADLAAFQVNFNIPNLPVNMSLGNHTAADWWCNANLANCGEGQVDLEYLIAICQTPTIYYYTHLGLSDAWLMEVATWISPPQVIFHDFRFQKMIYFRYFGW